MTAVERILFVTHYYEENIVGTLRTRHLKRMLEERSYQVTVISASDSSKINFVLRCVRAIVSGLFQSVYISCGPFYYLVPCVIAASASRARILVDLRDPWSANVPAARSIFSITSMKRRFFRSFYRASERLVYALCSWFVVCTPGMRDEYARLFASDSKLRLVTNGFDFDPAEYIKEKNVETGVERALCMGKFYYYSREKARAVLSLLGRRATARDVRIQMTFIGSEQAEIEALYRELHIEDRVELRFIDRMPYEQALGHIASADMGVIVIRNEDFDFGTKVFDFIGMGVPLLDTFDPSKAFRTCFRNYLVGWNEPVVRGKPDLSFHRDRIWETHLAILTGDQPR